MSAPAVEAPAASDAPLVRVESLVLAPGGTVLQRDLSFDVASGEVLVIMGPSGCGKSTLLRHLIGLEAPAAGHIRYGDEWLTTDDTPAQRQLRRRFGVMFQAGALWSSMSVGENVMLPLEMFERRTAADREQQAREMLDRVGLGSLFDRLPSQLSGGQRKRVAIARAMVLQPPLLYLDEPSAGLDPPTARQLDALLRRLPRDHHTSIVLVTHDLDSIDAVADRALYLDPVEKTMTALGPPDELRAHGPEPVRQFLNGRSAAVDEPSADQPTDRPADHRAEQRAGTPA